ncbi:MAG: hypothetical protein COB67_03025 [SAR324 cluster bacterium]|uniref:Uncharacterized protein n=1 Tax=SAR324 cluster bacterium TaxID=2024889 RepID=A0A2A4T8Q3_9DELT|nr:MAG: hypothetical protein COB67_03025 [SAR324 cluster bacterium]
MLRLLSIIFKSRVLRILIKTVGSLASAFVVISGYLIFLDSNSKKKEFETDFGEVEIEDEEEEEIPPTP